MSTPVKTKYEIVDVNHVEVTVDVSLLPVSDEMHFNATAIAVQFGKKPNDWLKTDQAQEYISVISRRENIRYENLVITKQGGKYQGTWLHNRLALSFARWCSVEFEYELDRWIEQRIEEEHQHQQSRLQLKTGFLPLTQAIESAHEDPQFYHFANECNLINRLVTGMDAKAFKQARGVENVRDALTAAESLLMDKLQTQNTALIELGFDYDERKRLLSAQVNKLKNPESNT
jgi:hypothetical protein